LLAGRLKKHHTNVKSVFALEILRRTADQSSVQLTGAERAGVEGDASNSGSLIAADQPSAAEKMSS
jgi:hypothetical protein